MAEPAFNYYIQYGGWKSDVSFTDTAEGVRTRIHTVFEAMNMLTIKAVGVDPEATVLYEINPYGNIEVDRLG